MFKHSFINSDFNLQTRGVSMSSGERKGMESLRGKFGGFYRDERGEREHRKWTEPEEQKIIELFKTGKTFEEIAKETERTPAAIVLRLEKLGFSVKL